VFEIERFEITRRLQTGMADNARRPWESRDRLRACAVSLGSSLSALYLILKLMLLCVVLLYRCKLNCEIENHASCEIRAVIGILNGKSFVAAEILRNFCCGYWPIIMSERELLQCVRQLKDGRTNVHYEDCIGSPSGREIKKQA
jgi:hypothetical protein